MVRSAVRALPAPARLGLYRVYRGRPLRPGVPSSDILDAEAHWTGVFKEAEIGPATRIRAWLEIPAVKSRYERLATGGSAGFDSWIDYGLGFAPVRSDSAPLRMLSLGSGVGGLERHLSARNAFGTCEGIDISGSAVEISRREAQRHECRGLTYRVADLNTLNLPKDSYDMIWFNMSLHHVEALESLLDTVRRSLTTDGVLVVHEYVGPNRFDFTPNQRTALSATNRLLPEFFRRVSPDLPRNDAPIPDPVAVQLDDPSEAVRSTDIESALGSRFHVVARHEMGGTLLQFLLNDIAWTFCEGHPATDDVLRMVFAIEDAQIASGELESDFVLIVARAHA